jgi:hypothetical protein
MAVANYGDLKTELTRVLFHARFTPDYDNATIKFESSANRRLRVRPMEAMTTLTTIDGAVALPADYLLWRTVLFTGTEDEIDYVHPAYLESTAAAEDHGVFTIEGNQFKARPINDDPDTYELHYYQRIPSLIGDPLNTNWLLASHPDAYIFGVLVELGALGRNVEMATLYKQRRDEVLQEIILMSSLTTGATSKKAREAEYF